MQTIFFFNHICVLETNTIQWILLATVQFDIFHDLALILLKQLCLELSLFKSSVFFERVCFDQKIDMQAS